jgi:uncharacterized protein (TIGR03083 family)
MTEGSYPDKAELLSNIDQGWSRLQAFIRSLTPEQIATPTDAAGWTVKDHLIHLALWEDGMNALLEHGSRNERMGIPQAMWDDTALNFDDWNAHIQQQNKDVPLQAVLERLESAHAELTGKLRDLPGEELLRPYEFYQADSPGNKAPVIDWIMADTYEHYDEHLPWMQAIANQHK